VSLNLEIGLILLQELALIALPAIAAAMFAASRGLRSQVLLIAVALVASGAAAMLVFWGFYADPEVGKTLAFLIEIGAAAGAVALWFGGKGREALRELVTPLALWALGTFFVVYLGYLHGWGGDAMTLAGGRFSHGLPNDNVLPETFSDWYWAHGHHGTPPEVSTWISSDRPPLQIGYILQVRPFGWDHTSTHYEMLGVALQQLWIFGAWALLRAARLGRRARGLALIAAMVSDIAIVHGFYVWPKLIAAAFVLAAAAMVFSPEWKRWVRDPRAAVLFAALCALGMLSHGSSAFLLIPLLVLAGFRGLPDWRWLGVAVASAFILYAPWQAYQHWADPPGNRLVKWQLGGVAEITDKGVLPTIVDAYREEGVGGTLQNKWENVEAIVGIGEIRAINEEMQGPESTADLPRTVEDLRWVRFLALLPCIGLLLLGPLALGARALRELTVGERDGPRPPEWRFAVTGGLLALATAVFWLLVMFGNSNSVAILHQGSLAVPMLAICACVAAAYAAWAPFAIGLVAVNAAFVLALYAPSIKPPEGTSYSAVAAVVAAIALVGFLWTAWRAPGTIGDGEYTPAP
jgi:4-amino-4-deoxy-L-arabinose transferase-like glycosyltransferase